MVAEKAVGNDKVTIDAANETQVVATGQLMIELVVEPKDVHWDGIMAAYMIGMMTVYWGVPSAD